MRVSQKTNSTSASITRLFGKMNGLSASYKPVLSLLQDRQFDSLMCRHFWANIPRWKVKMRAARLLLPAGELPSTIPNQPPLGPGSNVS